ncbi:MAG: M48 family metalloprotease [Chloroflexaceae bacterium]|nr:M48 family metalloprotease [Chloroflexaceae bacterium]
MSKYLPIFLSRWRKRGLPALLALAIALAIIVTGVPSYGFSWRDLLLQGIQVIQLSNLSDQQEVGLGRQINQQIATQVPISRNAALNGYINQIGQRLVMKSDRPRLNFTFQVVDDRNINAFATMGGFVYVNTGLITTAQNEAELASVIAHEIGHVTGRHAIQQMRQQAISQGVLSAAGINQSAAVQIGVDLAIRRPNSRSDELEADRFGLSNLRQANYAPIAMVTFMQKLLAQGGSGPAFLSTHPATSERIRLLQQQIDPQTASVGDGLDKQAYAATVRKLL